MLQTIDLMTLAHKVAANTVDAETAAKVRVVIADLTPEEIEFWRQTAPMIINPEGLREMEVVDYTMGP